MTEQQQHHILLVSCRDRAGLIHTITGALYRHGFNVVENGEHVDRGTNSFFMRTQVSGGAGEAAAVAEEIRAALPEGAVVEFRPQTQRRIVLLGTRETHCVGDLLLRQYAKELPWGKIVSLVSQYPELGELARRFEMPFHCVPVMEGRSREEHELRLLEVIADYRPDYIVLAKYMRVLGAAFLKPYASRIINIHHSFLPAFIGAKPYQQAYERGVKIIGATAHFVNENLDEGPIITQSVIPIAHSQDAEDMARSGRDIERVVLARALKLVLEDRVIVQGRRTLVFE